LQIKWHHYPFDLPYNRDYTPQKSPQVNVQEHPMSKLSKYSVCAAIAFALTGCASSMITPTYLSSDTELLRIGYEKPNDKEPVVTNMGSYCMQTSEKWKADGKTPDGQTIWSKDSLRSVVPCQ
jgi:hypothetical protein